MRMIRVVQGVALGASLVLTAVANGDETKRETDAEITARVCGNNRAMRAKIAQDDTKAWLARIDRVKSACRLTSTPTGAMIRDGNRTYPEMKSGVVCPGGVPKGETKETAWGILATLEPGSGTTERISEAHEAEDDLAVKCEPSDLKAGLTLRVFLHDIDGLRKILAWKPLAAKADGGSDASL